jgi:hypothetical protein
MQKRFISGILIICLMLTLVLSVLNDDRHYHAHAAKERETKYHLDIGVVHIWGSGPSLETATWQNGHRKGTSINVSTTLAFPGEVTVIAAYPYSNSLFNWNHPNYSFNRNAYLNSRQDFNTNYLDHVSRSISNINARASGNIVSLSYTVLLDSHEDFNLKERLNTGQFDFITELHGGRDTLRSNYPDLYQRLLEGAAGGLSDNVFGFMYFVPVIIEYMIDEEECDEEAQAVSPPDSSGCQQDTIQWSEILTHTYSCGGEECGGHTCNHVYTYRTTLTRKIRF